LSTGTRTVAFLRGIEDPKRLRVGLTSALWPLPVVEPEPGVRGANCGIGRESAAVASGGGGAQRGSHGYVGVRANSSYRLRRYGARLLHVAGRVHLRRAEGDGAVAPVRAARYENRPDRGCTPFQGVARVTAPPCRG
jgi:hypothetical protein